MLLKFGARNFLSFKEGIEISFKLPSKCPKSISKGKKVSNLICVKGANGSGKSNALKIISFVSSFCSESFSYEPDSSFMIDSYFHNKKPIDFFCEFQLDGMQYFYEISLSDKEVLSETLARKKERKQKIFTREKNELTYCMEEFKELKEMKLRSNASVISTSHQYEMNTLDHVYVFFKNMIANVSSQGIHSLAKNYYEVSKFYNEWPEFFDFTKDIIKKCDLGVEDISIIARKEEDEKERFFPLFKHRAKVKNNYLPYSAQSSGTKALFNVLLFYKNALEYGGVLILDEFDISFHPDILPVLIDNFENPSINTKNAQLIFTTHNTSIMDKMGKYRTFLINHDEGESFGYRLDEIPGDLVRNDRPIAPVYRSGKIGGVPRI